MSASPSKDMAVTDLASLPKLALGEVDVHDAVLALMRVASWLQSQHERMGLMPGA
jgi:hypothetical protein